MNLPSDILLEAEGLQERGRCLRQRLSLIFEGDSGITAQSCASSQSGDCPRQRPAESEGVVRLSSDVVLELLADARPRLASAIGH